MPAWKLRPMTEGEKAWLRGEDPDAPPASDRKLRFLRGACEEYRLAEWLPAPMIGLRGLGAIVGAMLLCGLVGALAARLFSAETAGHIVMCIAAAAGIVLMMILRGRYRRKAQEERERFLEERRDAVRADVANGMVEEITCEARRAVRFDGPRDGESAWFIEVGDGLVLLAAKGACRSLEPFPVTRITFRCLPTSKDILEVETGGQPLTSQRISERLPRRHLEVLSLAGGWHFFHGSLDSLKADMAKAIMIDPGMLSEMARPHDRPAP